MNNNLPPSMRMETDNLFAGFGEKQSGEKDVDPIWRKVQVKPETEVTLVISTQPKFTQSVQLLNLTSPFFAQFDMLLDVVTRSGFHPSTMMVAGGAVRDTLMGVEVKDIDLFIECDDLDSRLIKHAIALLGGTVVAQDATATDNPYEGAFKVTTIKSPKFDQLIQLIQVADLRDHLNTFNIGLSKVSYNADGLQLSKEFLTDVKNKTLTVSGKVEDIEYVKRISKKYPHLKLVVKWSELQLKITAQRPELKKMFSDSNGQAAKLAYDPMSITEDFYFGSKALRRDKTPEEILQAIRNRRDGKSRVDASKIPKVWDASCDLEEQD